MNETSKPIRPRKPKATPTPNEVVSREDAKARGLTQFFTGDPCMRGHISTRNVASGGCLECVRVRLKEKYAANPEKYRKRTAEYNKRVAELRGDFVDSSDRQCTCCKRVLSAGNFYRRSGSHSGLAAHCIECQGAKWAAYQNGPNYSKCLVAAKARKRRLKNENPKYEWARMVRSAMLARSRKRGDPHTDIDVEWVYENAPEICPLLGLRLNYANTGPVGPDSAVVDRIDNDIGYRKSNCWIISMKANRIKTNATLEEIETLAANFRRLSDATARDLV